MFKVLALIALVGAVSAQGPLLAEPNAAPEPYSYGYETDTHAASEQRDPSGTVTGFYTLADADGRARRVDYVADEAGFRAKVATNELGTKSENSADVEVQAAPPTEAQLAYVAPAQTAAPAVRYQAAAPAPAARFVSTATTLAQPARASYAASSYYQPGYAAQYGYYPGYNGYNGYNGFNGYNGYTGYTGIGGAAYNGAYNTGLAYSGAGNGGYFSSYNNHLPSQYYRSVQGNAGQAISGARYIATAQPAVAPVSSIGAGNFRTYGVSSAAPLNYASAGPLAPARSVGTNGNLLGSSNYIVLKKRA